MVDRLCLAWLLLIRLTVRVDDKELNQSVVLFWVNDTYVIDGITHCHLWCSNCKQQSWKDHSKWWLHQKVNYCAHYFKWLVFFSISSEWNWWKGMMSKHCADLRKILLITSLHRVWWTLNRVFWIAIKWHWGLLLAQIPNVQIMWFLLYLTTDCHNKSLFWYIVYHVINIQNDFG